GAPPPVPARGPRPGALRRALRLPHAGPAVLRHARPHGDHGAPRGHLARGRAARHLDVPGRGPGEDHERRGRRVGGQGAPVRPHGGDRGHPRRDRAGHGGRGHGGGPRGRPGHHGRPAGHRPRLQDAHRPGRRHRRRGADLSRRRPRLRGLPGRRGAGGDGRRRDAGRRPGGDPGPPGAGGPHAEVRLHHPELPEPGRGDHVPPAPAAPGGGGPRARAARPRGQPVRPAALRGRAAPDAVRHGSRRVRHLPRDLLEGPVARGAPGVDRRPAARAGQDAGGQGGGRPLLLPHDAVLRRRVLPDGPLGRVPGRAARGLPAPARHDARRALRALPGLRGVDAPAGRALRVGDAARRPGHHGPAGQGALAQRRLRPRAGGLPRRPRRDLHAPELLRGGRGRHPGGHPPHRRGRARAGGPPRGAHGPRALGSRDRLGAGAGGRAAARRLERRGAARAAGGRRAPALGLPARAV
ncbi:MAG: Aspartate aminotransferase (AspB-14), partial [uncultured Solirubrobacteraceae bacterium]